MVKIPVGVSECLLGEPVRFDGGHKYNRYLTEVLGQYMEFRPVCPEVAIGLGIPRKPIRIVATDRGSRILGVTNPDLDVTEALAAQAGLVAATMPDICGYVFMQNSPSCGVFDMKRYGTNGHLLDNQGRGAYAERLMALMPLLPVEEAGRLNDPGLRDNFIIRVFAFHDWKCTVAANPSAEKLIDFYSRYKYQVMAHHVPSYTALDKLLSDLSAREIRDVCEEFIAMFMDALRHIANRKGNTHAHTVMQTFIKQQP